MRFKYKSSSAIDGQINGGGGLDKFRIKVWDKNDGNTVVYDNQNSDPENAEFNPKVRPAVSTSTALL